MNIILPDLWQPIPEPPVQIPYVPDFWDSSARRANPVNVVEETLPKLNVVAGDTHFSGGPSHNLLDENDTLLSSPQTPVAPKAATVDDGLLGDLTDDLGLPRPKELKATFSKFFQ
ncbi:hypothetical protein H0H93_004499 [Arthromyces matolae]|nr:hypothetical protein H0H93_004499 [Arthromyces matolae]